MTSRITAFALVGFTSLASGCASRIGEFSVVATGAPQYNTMSTAPLKSQVQGSNGRLWLLFLPLGGAPNFKDAVDDCLDVGKGDFIERARFHRTWWSTLLVSYEGYRCTGDVGNSKSHLYDS